MWDWMRDTAAPTPRFRHRQADGAVEKDITYATALAVKKRLESLGATVLMPEKKDTKSSAVDRMQASQDEKADPVPLSPLQQCGRQRPAGHRCGGLLLREPFQELCRHSFQLCGCRYGTHRPGREWNYFRVTLSTLSPAVLLEMGFISHPQEYDNMCSKRGIFDTANAIGDSIIDYLS